MTALFQQKQATSKFSLAALLLSEPMITALRRELRRLFPGIKVEDDALAESLAQHVLKRKVVDSDEAKQAAAVLKKAMRSEARAKSKDTIDQSVAADEPIPSPIAEQLPATST